MMRGMGPFSGSQDSVPMRSRRRDLVEVAIAYLLILVVCWTPRPWQKLLWWIAVFSIAAMICSSFQGLRAMGLRGANFFRCLWVVGLGVLVSATAILAAVHFHTLRLPATPWMFVETYLGYAIWSFAQQFLLQCFFLWRLLRLLPTAPIAAGTAAFLFALAHLPNPILALVTLAWGFAACLLFVRYRDLYPLALTHALVGITIAITVPGPVDHNMRVGLGYLTYGHPHRFVRSAQP
jgi:membrane protease YdiL (CAAX protease family)